ncbi:MAG: hypothetical protein QNJ72_39290 [Pleurocapsa sp. MO_226.B13]|nr:hypothetical protein [Pleurocapsa sp. MO_226.B13]
MKGKYLEHLTLFMILIYTTIFLLFLYLKFPDNSRKNIEKQVNIKDKLTLCSAYTNPKKITENNKLISQTFESAILAAYRVEKSHIRSKNNADYAMMAHTFVWGASIVAPLYALIIFTFIEKSPSRNKNLAMIIGFIAVLNFINSAYDSHGRWGFSRVSHYYKESLIDQWSFRININCLTKTDSELVKAVYSETDDLLKNFSEHRNNVTPSFFSLKFNEIPDSSKVFPNN